MFPSFYNTFAVVIEYNKEKSKVLHISTLLWEGATLPDDVEIKPLVVHHPIDCASVLLVKATS